MSSIFLLGTRIDNVNMSEAVECVDHLLTQGGSHYVVTPNPEILLRAHKDPSLRCILNNSSLSLCDGTGAYLAALCKGMRLKGRVTGIDFMQELCAYAASRHLSVALVGGQQEIRRKTQEVLQLRYAGITIIPVDEFDEKSTSDIAFIALGSPKQEYWMARQKQQRNFNVMLAVGGAFDVLSGKFARAPRIMRRAGVEWAWRFLLEPQRASRIVAAILIFPATIARTIFFK